jgi:hypothetical protein
MQRLRCPIALRCAPLLLACVLALPARAQVGVPPLPAPAREFFPVLAGGLTWGGEKLATAVFEDDSTQSIRAGGLVQAGGGLLWQPAYVPFALQATVNYHVDSVTAANGELRFSRYPIELLLFNTAVPNWRFGGGARFVTNARLKVDEPGANAKLRYRDTIGAVAEFGYRFAWNGWVNFRLTAERYELESASGTPINADSRVSANSAGVNLVFVF